jgi:hypothetical protein
MQTKCSKHGVVDAAPGSAECSVCAEEVLAAAGGNATPRPSLTLTLPNSLPDYEKSLRLALIYLGASRLGQPERWKGVAETLKDEAYLASVMTTLSAELWRVKAPEDVHTKLIRAQLNNLARFGKLSKDLTLQVIDNTIKMVDAW